MARPEAVLDIECYRDYFLVMFSRIDGEKFKGFELFEGHPLDRRGIIKMLRRYTIVTFNGRGYDEPLLMYALTGATNAQLKRASDHIIQGNLKPWEFAEQYGVSVGRSDVDHIDLIEVAPGQASLKIYGGRLHAQLMQDLPYHFDDNIFPDGSEAFHGEEVFNEKRLTTYLYCGNDLSTTKGLRNKLLPQLELRRHMSQQYGVDLRSKSDAQIAEAVIRKRVEAIKGTKVYKPKDTLNTSFRYQAPEFLSYTTREMRDVFRLVKSTYFYVVNGQVQMPEELEKLRIRIGDSTYKLGIGGLHSTESCVSYITDEDALIVEIDVRSYYPSIILECELFPKHLGREFLSVYKDIYDVRLAAKDSGDKVTNEALKIVLNGSFGKFGSKYSILFSPNLLIQTTVTGQLALLMLIEMLESSGIPVVSANTDGLVINCPRELKGEMEAIVACWEHRTCFHMDTAYYKAIYSRDVNNYIAIKTNGEVKLKGAFAPPGLQKNPTNQICVDAVVNLLVENTPLEDTIEWCDDIRRFVSIKKVDGGGIQGGEQLVDDWVEVIDGHWARQAWIDDRLDYYKMAVKGRGRGKLAGKTPPHPVSVNVDPVYLGKAVRFYYSTNSPGPIRYQRNGNKVGNSDGALALMNLPKTLPDDIDYARYLDEAKSILRDINAEHFLEQYA